MKKAKVIKFNCKLKTSSQLNYITYFQVLVSIYIKKITLSLIAQKSDLLKKASHSKVKLYKLFIQDWTDNRIGNTPSRNRSK